MRTPRARPSRRRWLGWPASVALIGLLAMHGWSAAHEGRALQQHLRSVTVSAPVAAEAMVSAAVSAGGMLLAGRVDDASDRSFPLGLCLAVLAAAVLLLAAAAGWLSRYLRLTGRRHWRWLLATTAATDHGRPPRPLLTRLCVSRT